MKKQLITLILISYIFVPCKVFATNTYVRQALLFPFKIELSPMEALLLVNIEKDPDEVYLGFEPQIFNDTINGKGMLIIAWRTDGYVDIYHQSSLSLDSANYDIAGKGLASMHQVPLHGAYLNFNDQGAQCQFSFQDKYQRRIEVEINENHKAKRKPFGLLAPMGDAAQNPSAMPLVLLHDFYFVRKKNTHIHISINGHQHQADVLPMPIDRTQMTFIRYSDNPLIATLNPEQNESLKPITVEEYDTVVDGYTSYQLQRTELEISVKQMTVKSDKHELNLSFEPAFPNLKTLKQGIELDGRFKIEGHYSTGYISGIYKISHNADSIAISLQPTGGWTPRPDKLSLRFLYRVGKVFKNWPKSYLYTANIHLKPNNEAHIKSSWQRIPL